MMQRAATKPERALGKSECWFKQKLEFAVFSEGATTYEKLGMAAARRNARAQ